MKKIKYTKRFTNRQILANFLFFDSLTLFLLIIGRILLTSVPFQDNLISSLLIITLLDLVISKRWYGKIGKYRRRLNQLFERYCDSITVSGKREFPSVIFTISEEENTIEFKLLWRGKVSKSEKEEVTHRLSEVVFPRNEYLLEEPINTQADTTFKFVKKSERLQANYQHKEENLKFYNSNEIKLNSELVWNLNKQPHAAITGKTGSGKTQFLYYLINSAAEITDKIIIMDGKGGDLTNLTSVKVVQKTEEIVDTFGYMIDEMHNRIFKIKKANKGNVTATEIGLSPIFCFIDELAAILINAKKTDRKNKVLNRENSKNKSWQKLKEDNALDIIDAVTELILVARQASIHLILAAQHFDAKLLDDSTVRSNLAMKVLLGQQTPQEYNMLNLTQEQLPLVDFSTVGSGVIMLDGMGWINARPFETPFINFGNREPNSVLSEQLQKNREEKPS